METLKHFIKNEIKTNDDIKNKFIFILPISDDELEDKFQEYIKFIDYYDFFELKTGEIGIIIADIIGKGVPAALYMAMFKTLVHIHSQQTTSPSHLFNYLNKIMTKETLFNRYIPAFYAVLDPISRTLAYLRCSRASDSHEGVAALE